MTTPLSPLQRFASWLAGDKGTPCPLSVDELMTVLSERSRVPHELRRALLREVRAALAREPSLLRNSATLPDRFNQFREELAYQYRDDPELPPADRLQAALDALLAPLSDVDDLRRPTTLHLAGEIFRQRGLLRMQPEDLANAASYFRDAWQRERSPRVGEAGRRAGLLLLRLAKDAESSTAETRRREAGELFEDLAGAAELWLESAWKRSILSGVLENAERLSRAEAAWDAITARAGEILRASNLDDVKKYQDALHDPLEEAWDGALTLCLAFMATGEWDRAARWAGRLSGWESPFGVLHGDIGKLDARLADVLRGIVEVVALKTEVPETPAAATDVLVMLLKPSVRRRLRDWFTEQARGELRGASSSRLSVDESVQRELDAVLGAIEKADEFPLEDRDLRVLASRVVRANRTPRLGLALHSADREPVFREFCGPTFGRRAGGRRGGTGPASAGR